MQQNQQPQTRQRYRYHFTPKEMRRYFYKPSRVYFLLLIFGAFLFVLGTSVGFLGGLFIFLGLGCLAGGGIPLFIHYGTIPVADQYEKWVSERSQPLYRKALERLHLDESQCERIIEVQGGFSSVLQLTKKFPEMEIAVKRLPNGLRHYSINVCTYIFLIKDEIDIYSGYINAFAQNERFEDADHYYYQDIVGVSTSGPIYTLDGTPEKEIQRQGFFVRISNGESVGTDYATKVVMGVAENRDQIHGVDEVVAVLLSLLRDHKVTVIEANRISEDIR